MVDPVKQIAGNDKKKIAATLNVACFSNSVEP
jgi:hypothetical protein